MKKIFLLIFLLFCSTISYSQKVISGKSKPTKIVLKPEFKQGLPPNLYANMSFEDDNNNGILEAEESASLKLIITNQGKGPAQELIVKVIPNTKDDELIINDGVRVPYLYPGKDVEVNIPIRAGKYIKTAEHKLEISVKEYYGYDMDPAYLVFNTYKLQKPQLMFSGVEILDIGSGTVAIIEDNQIQAGELVKAKIMIQNNGQSTSKNTTYRLETNNPNIYLSDIEGNLGDVSIGEVKEFWVSISPNKRIESENELPIFLSLNNDNNYGTIANFQLPIKINQKPPEAIIKEVVADIESITKQFARFEYQSNKITANAGKIIDIKQILPSLTIRTNAIGIIIGVEKYNYFASAPYATNDAKIVEDYFKNIIGVNKVYTYTNKDVSGFFFENMFNPEYGELQKAIKKGETEVFVFYSGHGFPSKDGKNVFLIPADGRLEALNEQGYNLNKLYNSLNSLGAKNVIFFIDACFSGTSRTTANYKTQNLVAMKGVYIKPKITQPWNTNPNFTVFSSSGFNETSLGFDESGTGLFTYFLCAGLQGNADLNNDNKITTGELADYIQQNVKEKSKSIFGIQTPQFNGNENIILVEF